MQQVTVKINCQLGIKHN